MESNQIEYGGSNWNKESIRKHTRAQFVEHLRSQFLPSIPLTDPDKRAEAAGDLWDLCQLPKQQAKDMKNDTNSKKRLQSLDGNVGGGDSNNGGDRTDG